MEHKAHTIISNGSNSNLIQSTFNTIKTTKLPHAILYLTTEYTTPAFSKYNNVN